MNLRDAQKAAAARKSLDYIEDGMVVGLGSGSTANYMIEYLGERVRDGLKIRGVPSSEASASLARTCKIPLTTLADVDSIDVAIDGADEIGPGLTLIKGGGGALLHEKIVATSARKLVIVADEHKVVEQVGRFPLPVEVVPFAGAPVFRRLAELDANPKLRSKADGSPFLTDERNWIFDCAFGQIADPPSVGRAIKSITGVVEHGLFVGLASVAVVAGAAGVRVISR